MDESLRTKEYEVAKKYTKSVSRFIFGAESPSTWTKVVFYLNLVLGGLLLVWHILSYYAFSMKDLVLEKKNIDVEELLIKRAEELHLAPTDFLNKLLNFELISIFVWTIFLVGLIFLWRRMKIAFWIHFITLVAYYGVLILFLNLNFFNQDVSISDKVILGLIISSLMLFYIFLFRQKRKEREILENSEE